MKGMGNPGLACGDYVSRVFRGSGFSSLVVYSLGFKFWRFAIWM